MRELTPGPLTQHSVKARGPWGWVPVCGVVAVRAIGSTGSVWSSVGVRTVHVVHGFP